MTVIIYYLKDKMLREEVMKVNSWRWCVFSMALLIWREVKHSWSFWRGARKTTLKINLERKGKNTHGHLERRRLQGKRHSQKTHLEVEVEKTQLEMEYSTSGTRRRQSMVTLKWYNYRIFLCYPLVESNEFFKRTKGIPKYFLLCFYNLNHVSH